MNFSKQIIERFEQSNFLTQLKANRVVTMDNTEYSNWAACFPKGLFFGGLRRKTARSEAALVFGGAVHEGLKAFYNGREASECVTIAQNSARDQGLDLMLDPKRNVELVGLAVQGYISHCTMVPSERFSPVMVDNQPIVEQKFKFEIGSLNFKAGELFDHDVDVKVEWTGIVDLLAIKNNELWVVDHKTTSVMGEKFVDDKIRSNQMPGYACVTQNLAASLGRPIRGVIINAIAHRSKGFEFAQFTIPYSQWQLDEWQHETLMNMRRIILDAVAFCSDGVAVPNRECCVTKYGQCPYFSACNSIAPVRERMLFDEGLFKANEWNPLE